MKQSCLAQISTVRRSEVCVRSGALFRNYAWPRSLLWEVVRCEPDLGEFDITIFGPDLCWIILPDVGYILDNCAWTKPLFHRLSDLAKVWIFYILASVGQTRYGPDPGQTFNDKGRPDLVCQIWARCGPDVGCLCIMIREIDIF